MNASINFNSFSVVGLGRELKMYVADFRASFRQLRNWRATRGIVLALLLVAFGGGAFFGAAQNDWLKSRQEGQMVAAIRMMEANEESQGERVLTERWRALAMDKAVVNYVDDQSASVFSRAYLFQFVLHQFNPRHRETEKTLMKSVAEVRLKTQVSVRPDTIAELNKRGLDDKMLEAERHLSSVAASYTSVLGRNINARELIANSEMQMHVKYYDEMRAQALKNAAPEN